jgi:NitT/TauT family transport system permease protein
MPGMSLNTKRRWLAHIFVLLVFGAWVAASFVTPAYVIPSPLMVFWRVLSFFQRLELFQHVVATVGHVSAALTLSLVLGTLLALVAHYVPVTRLLIEGRIAAFLNSFSSFGWAIVAIVWFGLNSSTVIFVVTVIVLPLVIINMLAALDNVDAELTELGRSFTRKRLLNIKLVILPALYPFMFATARICFGVAWKVVLTAELFGGNSGFGFIVNVARQDLDTARIFAVVAIMIALFFLCDRFLFAPAQRALSKHYAEF